MSETKRTLHSEMLNTGDAREKIHPKMKALRIFYTVLVLMSALSSSAKASEPETNDQFSCYGPCLFLPMLEAAWQQLTRIERPIDVPESANETFSIEASAVDLVTNPGHPRLWFGTPDVQVSDTRCDVPIAGQDPTLFDGVANIRFQYESGAPSFTYVPDTEELPDIAPVTGWRFRPAQSDVDTLAASLREVGFETEASRIEGLTGKLVYVAQLNRGAIFGLGLDTSLEAFAKYTLKCHL